MPAAIPPVDPIGLRRVLGSFATGVTIITTCDPAGAPVGLTANSFNSVSLAPPLVLWSLRQSSRAIEAFRAASHWAVHVLAAQQQALSDRFARAGEDRFAGIDWCAGVGRVPLLPGCAAVLQCRNVAQHAGGDHVILIGEVLACDHAPQPPLLFHGGRYARLAAFEQCNA